MNTLKIYPDKRLQFVEENSIYITENKIQSFNIILPLTFGDYRTNELECEMRVYLSDDEYMSYAVSTASGKAEVPITNDITEKVQTVRIVFFFTKDGNVIGKTNAVGKKIEDAPYLGDPLTPRAEFDEVISEQRQTIAEQSQTIENQGETITQQNEQITELSGEVTELTAEKAELESLAASQRQEITYLVNNPPAPQLQAKQVAPSTITQVVTPDNGKDGMSSVTVDGVTAAIDSNIKEENIVNGVDVLGVRGTACRDIDDMIGGNPSPTFTSNVTTLNGWNFSKAPFETINLPKVETVITGNLFQDTAVTKNVLMNGLKYSGKSLFCGTGTRASVQHIEFNRLQRIDSGAGWFDHMSGLTEVSFPSIKYWYQDTAFRGATNLVTIILPSIETIYFASFGQTSYNIRYIIIGTTNCVCGSNPSIMFTQYRNHNTFLYFPDESVDTYKSATNWSVGADLIKPISELPQEIKDKYNEAKRIAEEVANE